MSSILYRRDIDLSKMTRLTELTSLVWKIACEDYLANFSVSDDHKTFSIYTKSITPYTNDELTQSLYPPFSVVYPDATTTTWDALDMFARQYPEILINDVYSPFVIKTMDDPRIQNILGNNYNGGDAVLRGNLLELCFSKYNVFYFEVNSTDLKEGQTPIRYAALREVESIAELRRFQIILSDVVPAVLDEDHIVTNNRAEIMEHIQSSEKHKSEHVPCHFQEVVVQEDLEVQNEDSAVMDIEVFAEGVLDFLEELMTVEDKKAYEAEQSLSHELSMAQMKSLLTELATPVEDNLAYFASEIRAFSDEVRAFSVTKIALQLKYDQLVERHAKYYSEQFRMDCNPEAMIIEVARKERITIYPNRDMGENMYHQYSRYTDQVFIHADDLILQNKATNAGYSKNEEHTIFLESKLDYPFQLVTANGSRIVIEIIELN